jgi:2-oxoglutarate dehydrogenase E2 component (dihydrolipoamide succinyltransferase)
MTNVIMPQMGESVTEGVITSWYKKLGDWVDKDESLLSITTDKVDADVPSPAAGYLTSIGYDEGATVEIDTVIAVLSASPNGAAQAEAGEPAGGSEAVAAPASGRGGEKVASASPPSPKDVKEAGVESLRRSRSSPLVRKMAAEHGVDLGRIAGTGISGRVTKHDLRQHLQSGAAARQAPPAAAPAAAGHAPRENRYAYQPVAGDRLEPFSPMRASIAEHMVISRETSVHVTTVFEVDMTRVARLRARHRQGYEDRGVKLSFMPFILKAVTQSINDFPIMNSAVVDRSIAYRREVNIGMAVAVDWGLLVPVIRQADEKSLLGLSRAVNDLADRARDRKLGPDDLQGGTFTVTNPGIFGSLFGTPIINQPQVAILCVGTIAKRPVVTEDDAIAIRHMMYLALSFDHRVIDGATADRFMKLVKDRLESFSEDLL